VLTKAQEKDWWADAGEDEMGFSSVVQPPPLHSRTQARTARLLSETAVRPACPVGQGLPWLQEFTRPSQKKKKRERLRSRKTCQAYDHCQDAEPESSGQVDATWSSCLSEGGVRPDELT